MQPEKPSSATQVWSLGLGIILIMATVLALWSGTARAIPAFARKYDLPCSTCHVPSAPKLNDFGNLFRDHGYQLGNDQDLPIYEGLTKGYWPVSLRTTVGYQAASLRSAGDGTPGGPGKTLDSGTVGFTGLDILSFGTLARNITFGVVFTPNLGSAGFGTGSDSDLEAAFLQLDDLFHAEYLLNFKVGKSDIDPPFSEHRSPTLNTPFVIYHYVAGTPYTTSLGNPGLVTVPTTVSSCCPAQAYLNPNDFQLGENHPELELFGIKQTPGGGYLRYSLHGVSNSDLNTGGSGGGQSLNFYGHVTQSFGGYGVVSGQRIGLFGAYGSVATTPNPSCPGGGCGPIGGGHEPFYRIGADVSLTAFNQLNLIAAYMHASDSKGLFLSQGVSGAQDAVWDGGFIELDYNPVQLPEWLFIYRYDLIRNSQQGDPTFANNFNNVDSHTAMARYNFTLSTRVATTLHAEYNYFKTKGTGANGGDQVGQTMLIAFDFAL